MSALAEAPASTPQSVTHQPQFEAGHRLRVVFVGHVDHGKSTLIGRIFYDTKSLPDGKVEQIQAACKEEGMEFEYAFLPRCAGCCERLARMLRLKLLATIGTPHEEYVSTMRVSLDR